MSLAQGKFERHLISPKNRESNFLYPPPSSLCFRRNLAWKPAPNSLLQNEIEDNTYKIYELRKTVEAQEDEIAELKQEVVNTTKLADAAHAREQNAQEVIENLRLNIAKLGLEIEQKNKQLAAEKE